MEKTTVGYAARDLGISRQLVHVYIKKGLIRAEKSGPEKTAPYVLEVEDVQKLIGSNKLVAAHAQRMRLLGKPKKKRAASSVGLADASAAGLGAAGILEGAAEVPLDSSEVPLEGTATIAAGTAGAAGVAGTAEGPLA